MVRLQFFLTENEWSDWGSTSTKRAMDIEDRSSSFFSTKGSEYRGLLFITENFSGTSRYYFYQRSQNRNYNIGVFVSWSLVVVSNDRGSSNATPPQNPTRCWTSKASHALVLGIPVFAESAATWALNWPMREPRPECECLCYSWNCSKVNSRHVGTEDELYLMAGAAAGLRQIPHAPHRITIRTPVVHDDVQSPKEWRLVGMEIDKTYIETSTDQEDLVMVLRLVKVWVSVVFYASW